MRVGTKGSSAPGVRCDACSFHHTFYEDGVLAQSVAQLELLLHLAKALVVLLPDIQFVDRPIFGERDRRRVHSFGTHQGRRGRQLSNNQRHRGNVCSLQVNAHGKKVCVPPGWGGCSFFLFCVTAFDFAWHSFVCVIVASVLPVWLHTDIHRLSGRHQPDNVKCCWS